jgi:hypothetical protein
MSRYRKPRGTYVRNSSDWFSDLLVAGSITEFAVNGKFGFIGLYNDAIDGSILQLLSLYFWVQSATASARFTYTSGVNGTIYPGSWQMMNPLQAQRAGSLTHGTTNSAVASWWVGLGGNNQPFLFSPGHPIATIPPGYTFAINSDTSNTAITASFYWLVLPNG